MAEDLPPRGVPRPRPAQPARGGSGADTGWSIIGTMVSGMAVWGGGGGGGGRGAGGEGFGPGGGTGRCSARSGPPPAGPRPSALSSANAAPSTPLPANGPGTPRADDGAG